MNINWSIAYLPLILSIAISAFIYCLLKPRQREWALNYLLPILFFLILAGENIWHTIQLFTNKEIKGYFILLRSVSNLVVISFLALAITSYIIRTRPIKKAVGIKERVFPLFVLFTQVIGAHLIALLAAQRSIYKFPGAYFIFEGLKLNYDIKLYMFRIFLKVFNYTRYNYNPKLYILGIVFTIIGTIFSCLALWELKRSFSIMVEIRQLITKGVYSKIRHPLYAGEILSVLGISLIFNNLAAYGLFALLSVMQLSRALLEEKKLISFYPEYIDYKKRAGFFSPKLLKPR